MAHNCGVRSLHHVTVVFDLDGTLVDTAPDIHAALCAALATAGLPAPDLDQARLMIGKGARVLVERALSHVGASLAPERIDALAQAYLAAYAADVSRLSRAYDGVEDALAVLAGRGARLAVCTNKPTALSNALLEAIGLRRRFAAIVGGDAVARHKPDAGHFIETVRLAGGHLAASMMIGDSATDLAAARAAGAPVALATFGYSETAPGHLGPDAVFSHYRELPDIVSSLADGFQAACE